MPRYDFADLTDDDFERLVRDLLQRELGLQLTSFSPGRDQGIDIWLLGVRNSLELVVQCKKWDAGAFSRLLRDLRRKESPKVARLQPGRYRIVTSVNLTPHRKQEIYELFQSYMENADDVLGRDDINNLIAKYPEVERAHYKLWLTSTTVLEQIINNLVLLRSTAHIDDVRSRIRLYVRNRSFDRALWILRRHQVCLITGPPGIGKSMLADMLLFDYASEGTQAVTISEDIAEAEQAWHPTRPQVFHYDDFLGMVRLSDAVLNKNEDSRLVSFLHRVRRHEGKYLILTTRDYILADARQKV